MALINCPECGKQISDKAPNCPNCGYPINMSAATPSSNTATASKNLLILAHRAKEEGNAEKASLYYEQILLSDPDCWEAYFYSTYFSALASKKGELYNTVSKIINCEKHTFMLIASNVNSKEEQRDAANELVEALNSISKIFIKTLNELCVKLQREPGLFRTKEYYMLMDSTQYHELCPRIIDILSSASILIKNSLGKDFDDIAQKSENYSSMLYNSLIFKYDPKKK